MSSIGTGVSVLDSSHIRHYKKAQITLLSLLLVRFVGFAVFAGRKSLSN